MRQRKNQGEGLGGTDSSGEGEQLGGSPLELEGAAFEPAAEPSIAPEADDDYEPAPPGLLEWSPERAGAVVRVGGFGLHMVDPVAREPGAERLWRATEQDAQEIGAPLARILNRYAPARRLAGVVDEGELGFAVMAYVRRNLAERGRVLADVQLREQGIEPDDGAGGEMFHDQPPGA